MVSILYIFAAIALIWYNPYDSTYGSCAVGFSGVLFALKLSKKIIKTHHKSQITNYKLHTGCIELWK